jgi:hypothetical protein
MTRTFNIPVDVPPSVGYYNDITDYTHTDFWYSTPKYNVNEPNWDNVAMPEDNNIIWQLRYCGKNPTEYDHGYSLSDFVYIKFDGHVAGGAFVFELKLDFTNLDIPHMGPKTVELVGEQLQEIWHTEDTQQYHDHPAMTMWTDTGHDYADQAPGFFRFEIYHQQN